MPQPRREARRVERLELDDVGTRVRRGVDEPVGERRVPVVVDARLGDDEAPAGPIRVRAEPTPAGSARAAAIASASRRSSSSSTSTLRAGRDDEPHASGRASTKRRVARNSSGAMT